MMKRATVMKRNVTESQNKTQSKKAPLASVQLPAVKYHDLPQLFKQ